MEERHGVYSLGGDWGPEQYSRLLDLAMRFGKSFVVVNRAALSAEREQLRRSIGPFALCGKHGVAWPGTRLLNAEMADIYTCVLNTDFVNVLCHAARSIWEWLRPRYPEDLSFPRSSGIPWCVSITHERDAFVKLLEGELPAVKAILGAPLAFQCEDQRPGETY
jgi:hypothetical protein